MAYSYVQLPGNGTTTNFNFPFGYLSQDHIHVRVNGEETPYTFLTANSVQVTPAPANGSIVEIRRITPLDQPIVDWTDGSLIAEEDMDLNTIFNLYANQEARDYAEDSIQLDETGVWDGRGRTTKNFADPVGPDSLVTKSYHDGVFIPQVNELVQEAQTYKNAAAASATASAQSAVASAESAEDSEAALTDFKRRYQGASPTNPTTRFDGTPLQPGDLYFNSSLNQMRVWATGNFWTDPTPTIQTSLKILGNPIIATEGQTVVAVDGGYDAPFIVVYVNGAQVNPPAVDVSDGANIVFATPLEAGDEVTYTAFGAFRVADAVSYLNLGDKEHENEGATLVGYRPEWAEAPGRDVRDRLLDDVSVLDFLTPQQKANVRSGVYDSTVVSTINEALQWYSDNNKGVYVDFGGPQFTFVTRESIMVPTNIDVILDGRGAMIFKDENTRALRVEQNLTNITTVTSVASSTYVLATGEDPSVVTALTLSDITGYQVGDYIKVVSDDELSGYAGRREGEFARVGAIAGNVIYTLSPLAFQSRYITNVRVGRLPAIHRFVIRDFVCDHRKDPPASWNNQFLRIQGMVGPKAENLTCLSSASQFLGFHGCLFSRSDNIHVQDLRTGNGSYGYGVLESNGEYGLHTNIRARNCRHAFTTAGLEVDPNTDPLAYGRTKYARVIGGMTWNGQTISFDTHPDAYMCEFIGCSAHTSFRGPIGGRLNFQLRGKRNRMVGCKSFGGTGFRLISQSSGSGTDGGNEENSFIDCEHTFLDGDVGDADNQAFRIQGSSTSYHVMKASIINPVVRGGGAAFDVRYGDVTIINPVVITDKKVESFSVFRVGAQADIVSRGGVLNANDAQAGSTITLVNCYASSGPAAAKIDGFLAETSASPIDTLVYLGDNSNVQLTGHLDCELTQAPTADTHGTTGAQFWLSAKTKDGTYNSDIYHRNAPVGGAALGLNRRGGEFIYVIHSLTGSAIITSIANGRFPGQKVVLVNGNTDGTFTVEVPVEGSTVAIPERIILNPKQSATLWWDGSVWRPL